jgi:hypothetical protein
MPTGASAQNNNFDIDSTQKMSNTKKNTKNK